MTPNAPALCFLCHYYEPGTSPENDSGKPRCQAFPEGIPSSIFNGGFDHREPLGDEAITFRLAEGKTEEDVKVWEQQILEIDKSAMIAAVDGFSEAPPVDPFGANTEVP